MQKSHIKIVRFEVEKFEHLHSNTRVNKNIQILELIKITQKKSTFIQPISMCSFLCKNPSAGWMGGWVEVKAG